jgi:hypothetical protein
MQMYLAISPGKHQHRSSAVVDDMVNGRGVQPQCVEGPE